METLKFSAVALILSLLATPMLFLSFFGKPNEVCVSKGGRFPPYPLARKAPGKANDLIICRVFRGKTCCGVEQEHSASLSARKLAFKGEARDGCVNLWKLLECSICDPKIGVQPGGPLICASLCDQIFSACSEAYLGKDTNSGDIVACGPGELVCGKASGLFSNGTQLCSAAGFSVLPDDPGNVGLSEEYCYGGWPSPDSIHTSRHSSQKRKPEKSAQNEKTKSKGFNEVSPPQVRKTFLDNKVYCVLGLTVLAAALFFLRFRRRDPHYERIAAILRGKEKLDGMSNKKNKDFQKKKYR